MTKCTPDSINRELAHLGVVLFVVVERQSGQPLDAGFFVGLIQLDLERGPGSALRADEALLAEAHVEERHAINRHAGLDVRVRGIYLLELPLRLQGLEEIARLISRCRL